MIIHHQDKIEKKSFDYMMAKPKVNNDNIEIVANDLQQEKNK